MRWDVGLGSSAGRRRIGPQGRQNRSQGAPFRPPRGSLRRGSPQVPPPASLPQVVSTARQPAAMRRCKWHPCSLIIPMAWDRHMPLKVPRKPKTTPQRRFNDVADPATCSGGGGAGCHGCTAAAGRGANLDDDVAAGTARNPRQSCARQDATGREARDATRRR